MDNERKKKISESCKGRIFSEEHKQKISKGLTGRVLSEKSRQKIAEKASIRQKGKELPDGMSKRTEHIFIDGIESKTCSNCNLTKPIERFSPLKRKGYNLFDCYCKDCRSAIKREYYQKNREKLNKAVVEKHRDIKIKSIEYKGSKCTICGLEHKLHENTASFQFHHVDPKQKEFAITTVRSQCFETIKSELDKCVLVCANCHSNIHYKGGKS